MKTKIYILAAMLLTSIGAMAERTEPQFSGNFVTLSEEGNDTLYLFNVTHNKFYTYGNDWNTHATIGAEGILVVPLNQGQANSNDDPSTVYILRDYPLSKKAWKDAFLTRTYDEEENEIIHMYTDRGSQADNYFCFEDAGNNTFRIYGSEFNGSFCHSEDGYQDYYISVDPNYVNTEDAANPVVTGTGIVYVSASVIPANTWAWVSQEEYAAYSEQVRIYQHAQELYELIESANALGVSTSEAQAVYDNLNASYDDITAAIDLQNKLLGEHYAQTVTPDNPQDMTSLVKNPGFEDGLDGWVNGPGFATFERGTNSNHIDGTHFTGSAYLNLWHPNSIKGQAYQEITDMPNGVYVVTMAAFTNTAGGQVFANDYSQDIVVGGSGRDDYEVTAVVTDGTLRFGYQANHESGFWSEFDNVRIKYYGSGVESYQYWVEQSLASAPDYSEARATEALKEAYNTALENLKEAKSQDEVMAAVTEYLNVLKDINANIEAYNQLEQAITEANDILVLANDYYGQLLTDCILNYSDDIYECNDDTETVNAKTEQIRSVMDDINRSTELYTQLPQKLEQLMDYIQEYGDNCDPATVIKAEALYNELNGKADEDYSMTNEQIEEYIANIDQMIYDLQIPFAPASDDNPVSYTIMLANPDFEQNTANKTYPIAWETDGQLSDADVRSWAMDGEMFTGSWYVNLWDADPCGRLFQTVTGIPNGTYSVSASIFANTDNSTWLFANDDNVYAPKLSGDTSMPADRYTVYTTVTDGTLTFGIILYTEDEGQAAWTTADNFTLTYYGEDSEHQPSGADLNWTAVGIDAPTQNPVITLPKYDDAVYDLCGRRVDSNNLPKGIYIKNGKKFMVK